MAVFIAGKQNNQHELDLLGINLTLAREQILMMEQFSGWTLGLMIAIAALSLFFDFTKVIWPAAARVEWVTTKMAHECDPTPAVLGDWDVVKRVATLVSTPFSGKHWPRSCTTMACIPVATPTKAPVATKPEASVDAETARRLRELGLDVSSVLDPTAKFADKNTTAANLGTHIDANGVLMDDDAFQVHSWSACCSDGGEEKSGKGCENLKHDVYPRVG